MLARTLAADLSSRSDKAGDRSLPRRVYRVHLTGEGVGWSGRQEKGRRGSAALYRRGQSDIRDDR